MSEAHRRLERRDFDQLLLALAARGYEVIGPTVKQGAIVLEPIDSAASMPVGLTDEQDGGHYRLVPRDDDALFGFATGPQSWKRLLHPPALKVWTAKRDEASGAIAIEAEPHEPPAYAFIGVRSCDLHAIRALDDALLNVAHPDPEYKARREKVFIVALNCSTAGGTCFCVSMKTGPRASFGYDLALTEITEDGEHFFVCEAASDRGAQILADLPSSAAVKTELKAADEVVERTAASMGRRMPVDDPGDLRDLLQRNLEHPRWDEVADRCLSCGNCTSVCPTCFCTDVDDVTELAGAEAERWRRWDSCFTLDFSYLHGGSVRTSTKSRYRQWMTHKLSTWYDQFGTSGCVGCGRCIAWCPVAIDITEEAAAIHASDEGTGP